jgi:glycosyltransferase involved in cell wall biosynthesis
MNSLFFSIIICTFNRASLLPRALDSLLAQTDIDIHNWEAIIVDDGSTDATKAVVEPYLRQPSNIRYVYHTNRGTGASRTVGVEAARGLYVTFLDSDDEYAPTHLATRKGVLQAAPELDLLHGGVEVIGDPYVADKDDPTKLVHLSACVVGGTFFIKRDVVRRLGGFGTRRYADDAAFFEKAERAGVEIRAVQPTKEFATYRYYRTTEDSLCTTTFVGDNTTALTRLQ